jgi:hypothetical protein
LQPLSAKQKTSLICVMRWPSLQKAIIILQGVMLVILIYTSDAILSATAQAAELPQTTGPGPLAGVRQRAEGAWYAAQDGAASTGRSVLAWVSAVGVWAQGLWQGWWHSTWAMWQATGDAAGRVWAGLLALLGRVWAGTLGLWVRVLQSVANLAQRGQTPT